MTARREVICGPPGSGKSSYVNRHAVPGDLRWDLDDVAAVLGYGCTPSAVETVKGSRLPRELAALLVYLRDALTTFLAEYRDLDLNVYVIISDELIAGVVAEEIGAEVVQCR